MGRGENEWGEGGMSGERGEGVSIGVVNRQKVLDVVCTASTVDSRLTEIKAVH